MTTTEKHPLSDTLDNVKTTNETYGLFPVPVSKYTVPNHEDLKKDILSWMNSSDIIQQHVRSSITHNVTSRRE